MVDDGFLEGALRPAGNLSAARWSVPCPLHMVWATHLHPLPLVVRGVLDNGADAVLIDVVFVFWALWMIGRDLDQRI